MKSQKSWRNIFSSLTILLRYFPAKLQVKRYKMSWSCLFHCLRRRYTRISFNKTSKSSLSQEKEEVNRNKLRSTIKIFRREARLAHTQRESCEDSHLQAKGKGPQKKPNLPGLWFWTSSFQNHEKINFCCLKKCTYFQMINHFRATTFHISLANLIHQNLDLSKQWPRK